MAVKTKKVETRISSESENKLTKSWNIVFGAGHRYYLDYSTKTLRERDAYIPDIAVFEPLSIEDSIFMIFYCVNQTYSELNRPKILDYNNEATFHALAEEWKRERPHGVDVSDMAMHPSYQSIIGMGYNAVPFILRELERKPDHWFWALYAITGVNPVLPESEGNLKKMTEAWLDWGRNQGYQW